MGRLAYQDIVGDAERLLALTSLTKPEFAELVVPFETAFQEYMAVWTLEGKPRQHRQYVTYANSPLPTSEDRLFFILSYLKQNPTQEYHGVLFRLPQNKVNQWVHTLFPVLQIALRVMGDAPCRNHAALADRLGTALAASSTTAQERDLPPADPAPQRDELGAPPPLFVTTAPNDPSRAPRTRRNKRSITAARKSDTP
jgi:hypothetical protein